MNGFTNLGSAHSTLYTLFLGPYVAITYSPCTLHFIFALGAVASNQNRASSQQAPQAAVEDPYQAGRRQWCALGSFYGKPGMPGRMSFSFDVLSYSYGPAATPIIFIF